MGTNYYTILNTCKCCNRYDRDLHIGKSSSGWTFSFQAYIDWIPDFRQESITIKSYKDWLNLLESENLNIKDEYGRDVSLDEFKRMVEVKRSEKNNHAVYMKEAYSGYQSDFLDEEGNSFSIGEFS